jgi:CDP-diacylglycerol--glycerol-3-phosphate 3-phosphatidyltransferase
MAAHSVAIRVPPDPGAHNRQALDRLRRRWLLTTLVYAAGLAGGYWFLYTAWQPAQAIRWLAWAGLAMVVELVVLWRNLPQNHPPDGAALLPTFGYGTALTLLCGLLLSLLAGFLFAPQPAGLLGWLPALLYTVARMVDYVDGYVARITHHETKLGSILDIEFDGLGVLIAILLGIQYGKLPLWYLPLALSRQLFIAGIWWRKRWGKPVYEMAPSANRRIIAGFQTGFVSVMLWPVFTPPLTTLAAVLFALPLFFSFLRDWLVVSGAIDPGTPNYQRGRAIAKALIEGWLPLVCRLLGTAMALIILAQELPGFPGWRAYFVQAGVTSPDGLLWGLSALFVIALPFFLLGIVGRVAALVLVGMGMLDITATELYWSDNAWLFIASVVVAHAGSGRLALWRPEEAILHRRPGEQKPVAS